MVIITGKLYLVTTILRCLLSNTPAKRGGCFIVVGQLYYIVFDDSVGIRYFKLISSGTDNTLMLRTSKVLLVG